MKTTSLRLSLLGPANVGKSTFAKKLSEYWNIPSICTGELIRKQIGDRTALGIEHEATLSKGLLVPDQVSTNITYNAVQDYNSFILDGYPRRVLSAQLWQQDISKAINCVIHLSMNPDVLIKKSQNRLICSNTECNAIYNCFHIDNEHYKLEPLAPIKSNVCDLCGSALHQRNDDDRNVLLDRIQTHYNEIDPILEFYKTHNIPTIEFKIKHGINDFQSLVELIEAHRHF
eukprot:213420_1